MLLYLFIGFIVTFLGGLAMHKDNSFHTATDGTKISALIVLCLLWFWFLPLSALLQLSRKPKEPKSKWWLIPVVWVIWAVYAAYLGGFIG